MEILPGDLFGQPPTRWYERWACKLQGSKTFHWGWFVAPTTNDWATSEAIGTGVDITRLAERPVYVYRIRKSLPLEISTAVEIHSRYGDLPYSWEANIWTAIWFISKWYFGKVLPIKKDIGFNCVGWVVCYAAERGYDILPADEPASSIGLEKSPCLEYIGIVN